MNNVEIYIQDQIIDIEDGEDIVQSFAVHKFGDISTRNSSYSNTFNLPITARNRAVFESPEVILNNSTIPYSKLSCTIYVDGIPVVIGFAQLVGVKESYEVKVFGTNFDFFSVIKPKFLSELDLSAYDHTWNLANVAGSRTSTAGYIYGLICYQNELSDNYFPITNRGVDVRQLYPGMFLHTVIDKIITEAGFEKSADAIWTNENYLSVVLPFSKDRFAREENTDEDFKAIKTAAQIIPDASSAFILFENDSTGGGFDNGGNYTISQKYTAPFAIKATFTANLSISVGGSTTRNIILRIYKNGFLGTVLAEIAAVQLGDTTVSYTLTASDVTLAAGDYIEVLGDTDFVMVVNIGSTFESQVQPDILFGTEVQMSGTIPKIKQGDLFRWFLQMFQGVCQVKNGVVYVKTFGEIAGNTANALDWSDKVDESEDTDIKFNMDKYSQINNLKYKDDESVVKPIGTDYELLIGNENLEAESDLITSPFSASQMITRLINEYVPWIRSNAGLEITEKVQPRILILDQRDVDTAITYTDATSNVVATNSLPFMYFILPGNAFNLGFEDSLIPLYGDEVVEVLQEQKVLKKLMRINSSDINQLDFFLPIWIDKYNCYFFISQIEQYKINKVDSTIVELVKLPS